MSILYTTISTYQIQGKTDSTIAENGKAQKQDTSTPSKKNIKPSWHKPNISYILLHRHKNDPQHTQIYTYMEQIIN